MGPLHGRFGAAVLPAVGLLAVAACGRTELETRPWHDYEAGRPWQPQDVADLPPDVPADVVDGEPEVEPDVLEEIPDVPPDGPEDAPPAEDAGPEFHGLSCMSAAMCAFCCPPSDFGCQLGCVTAADPSASGSLMAIVGCIASSGCGGGGTPDLQCLMEECGDELDACSGGPGGTGGCLSLAWCLVSSGCASVTECEEQGLCYQACFGAARPEVIGAARELVICMAGTCMTACLGGLTTLDCLGCLATNCLIALRGCVGL